MTEKPAESGMEELMRLSRQTSKVQQQITRKEREHTDRTKVVQGLKDLKITVALEQLRLMAKPEITETVASLKNKQSTAELRKIISDIALELENSVDNISAVKPDVTAMERPIKTLAILIELLFSLE
ncbi:hypothetical protein ACFLXH_05575 [Chloroflexota bacterium]